MSAGGGDMSEARLNIRIDAGIKEQAESVFQQLGLTLSSGVNIFLSKVVAEQGIPFPLTIDRADVVGYESYKIEQAAIAAVREEIAEYKSKGLPVARYDAKKKLPYLEYPDGSREYTIE